MAAKKITAKVSKNEESALKKKPGRGRPPKVKPEADQEETVSAPKRRGRKPAAAKESDFEGSDETWREEKFDPSSYIEDEAEVDFNMENVASDGADLDDDVGTVDDSDMPEAPLDDYSYDDVPMSPMDGDEEGFEGGMVDIPYQGVLGAEERNAIIQEVKQRSEKNGGFVTYDELNQIVPFAEESTIEEYLAVLQQINVHVIRAEDADDFIALKDKQGEGRLSGVRAQEIFDDPIRMYLHQMGQVELLSKEQEQVICQQIEEAETKIRSMFNRFAFTPEMYIRLLDKLEAMNERFDRVVTDEYEENRDAYMAQLPTFRKNLQELEQRILSSYEKQLELRRNKKKKPTAQQVANDGIKSAIVEGMESAKAYTITDIIKSVPVCADLTNQRVSALMRQLVEAGEVVRTEDKRKA
jgi:hypothetical protein